MKAAAYFGSSLIAGIVVADGALVVAFAADRRCRGRRKPAVNFGSSRSVWSKSATARSYSRVLAVGETAAMRGGCVARIEPDGLAQVGDGAVELAALVIRHAAVVIGGGEIRVELDRAVEILEGAFVVVQAQIGKAARVECGGVLADRSSRACAKSAIAFW